MIKLPAFLSKPSRIAVILISLYALFQLYQYVPWKKNRVIENDVSIYYSYLPATFIYGDWSFSFAPELNSEINPDQGIYYFTTPEGKPYQKYTMGVALMESPFFLLGLGASRIGGYPTHGYSVMSQNFLALGALFYLVISLIFLRRILLRYFNEWVTAALLITLALGTNLYFYSVLLGGMSHVHSVAGLIIFTWLFLRWLDSPKLWHALLIGLVAGVVILVRPTNLVFLSLVGLIGVTSLKDIRERVLLYIRKYPHTLAMILGCFAVVFIQLIFWKTQTGYWYYYTYGEERFYFDKPHIFEGLLSYRNGMLVYSPILFFAFIGWGMLWFKKNMLREFKWALIFLVPVTTYLAYSWWCWWYAGSFGNRGLIEMYPFYMLLIGVVLQTLYNTRKMLFYCFLPIIAVACYINIKQSYYWLMGSLHYDAMTKEAYWKVFMDHETTVEYYDLLQAPDYEAARAGKPEFSGWNMITPEHPWVEVGYAEGKDMSDTLTISGEIHGDLQAAMGKVHCVVETYPEKDSSEWLLIRPTSIGAWHFRLKVPVIRDQNGTPRNVKVFLNYSGKAKVPFRNVEVIP